MRRVKDFLGGFDTNLKVDSFWTGSKWHLQVEWFFCTTMFVENLAGSYIAWATSGDMMALW